MSSINNGENIKWLLLAIKHNSPIFLAANVGHATQISKNNTILEHLHFKRNMTPATASFLLLAFLPQDEVGDS